MAPTWQHKDCPGCNYHVKGCPESCVYAALFLADGNEEDMNAAFSVFGVNKFELQPQQLADVNQIRKRTIWFEANAREHDRLYGVTGIVLSLHMRLRAVTREFNIAREDQNAVTLISPSTAAVLVRQHHPIPNQIMMPTYDSVHNRNQQSCPGYNSAHNGCPGCNYRVIGYHPEGNCVYGSLFRLERTTDNAAAFSFFGTSIAQFWTQNITDVHRLRTIRKRTIWFEVNARDYDHVYGMTGIVLSLHKRLAVLTCELNIAEQQLSSVGFAPASATWDTDLHDIWQDPQQMKEQLRLTWEQYFRIFIDKSATI